MRKVITFLGTYPKDTTYLHKGQTYEGRVFAEALRQFLSFDQMLVFTTPEAREETWPILRALDDPRLHAVPIPTGRDEDELWAIFTRLTQEVAQGDTVIFDITHGLRSIPFLVFLAAAYLKEARGVRIERIIYGAYELGQPAPVIDLSEFAALLDWLTATYRFAQLGDGRPLADLLRGQALPHSEKQTPASRGPREALEDAATAIKNVDMVHKASKRGCQDLYNLRQAFGLVTCRRHAEHSFDRACSAADWRTAEIELRVGRVA